VSLYAVLLNKDAQRDLLYSEAKDLLVSNNRTPLRVASVLESADELPIGEEEREILRQASAIVRKQVTEETKLWKRIHDRYPCTRN
jgi:hypothetical protein